MRCKCGNKLPDRSIRKTMKVPHATVEGYFTIVELDEEEDLCSTCLSVARSMYNSDLITSNDDESLEDLGLDLPYSALDNYWGVYVW